MENAKRSSIAIAVSSQRWATEAAKSGDGAVVVVVERSKDGKLVVATSSSGLSREDVIAALDWAANVERDKR
jgi:hypothetical protein